MMKKKQMLCPVALPASAARTAQIRIRALTDRIQFYVKAGPVQIVWTIQEPSPQCVSFACPYAEYVEKLRPFYYRSDWTVGENGLEVCYKDQQSRLALPLDFEPSFPSYTLEHPAHSPSFNLSKWTSSKDLPEALRHAQWAQGELLCLSAHCLVRIRCPEFLETLQIPTHCFFGFVFDSAVKLGCVNDQFCVQGWLNDCLTQVCIPKISAPSLLHQAAIPRSDLDAAIQTSFPGLWAEETRPGLQKTAFGVWLTTKDARLIDALFVHPVLKTYGSYWMLEEGAVSVCGKF